MRLVLTLFSDSVPGSGECLAGIIDTEISRDKFGIPYIPARRIKGILREAAKDLEELGEINFKAEEIFGKPGEKFGSDFKITDGYLKDYQVIRAFLTFVYTKKELPSIFNPQTVLSYFTYTRTQTALEEGVAKKDTLRTIRVLKKGLKFYFVIECRSEYKEDLKKICKVTRHFGLRRTRGLGEIKLELKEDEERQKQEKICLEKDEQGAGIYELSILIENLSDLLLTTRLGRAQVSDSFICGSFILGAFARAYISRYDLKNAHEDEDFYRLFLSGEVKFLNAYPTDGSWNEYYPTPASIAKEKDKERYFNFKWKDVQKDVEKDVQVEKPKFEYMRKTTADEIEYISVIQRVEYHHQRPVSRTIGHPTENDGEFFQFEVIEKEQKFLAKIIGTKSDLKILTELIPNDSLIYLGKSKTAQYGRCRLEYGDIKPLANEMTWEEGEEIVLRLLSDMVLVNEYGFVVPDVEVLKKEVALNIGIEPEGIEIKERFLKFKKVSGFLGVWGLPKIQTQALAAGSILILKNKSGEELNVSPFCFFGLRQEEGYGMVAFEEYEPTEDLKVKSLQEEITPSPPSKVKREELKQLIQFVVLKYLENKLKEEALEKLEKEKLPQIPNAFLGKMMFFLKDSKKFEELNEKLMSLKTKAIVHLEKIAKNLFVKDKQVKDKQVEKEKFQNMLEQKMGKIPSVLDKVNIKTDFWVDRLYDLYKTYSHSLLIAIRLKQRGNAHE
jgi:CRISPR-associated protein Csx10